MRRSREDASSLRTPFYSSGISNLPSFFGLLYEEGPKIGIFAGAVLGLVNFFIFSHCFLARLKKGKDFLFCDLFYGRFLVTRSASTAPIMTMTTMIATIPYMTVVFEAKPLSGVAVTVGPAGGLA